MSSSSGRNAEFKIVSDTSDSARGVAWSKLDDWYMIDSRDEEHMIWPPSLSIAEAMSSVEREWVV
jgi:hypothetical protein